MQDNITTDDLEAVLQKTSPKLTRREFFKIMFKSALGTGAIVALNGSFAVIPAVIPLQDSQDKAEKLFSEAGQDIAAGKTLQVRYFANDISYAAARIASSGSFLSDIGTIITGWYVGDVIGSTLDKKLPEKMPYAGTLAAVAGKGIDLTSTNLFVVQMNDPRFTLYGLDAFNSEINPFVGSNPSRERLIIVGAILTILIGFISFQFPSLGIGYLGASGFIYRHNAKGAVQIATSLALGDEVDSQIKQGRNPEGIQNYLKSVGAADIEERVELSLRQSIANYKNNNAELPRA